MVRDCTPRASGYTSYVLPGNEIITVPKPLNNGSGSRAITPDSDWAAPALKTGHACKYFPADWLLPVALKLRIDTSGNCGSGASAVLTEPAQLLQPQDADFAGCWFSQAIDLGDDSQNPPFWVLRKTARDTWLLRLRRGKGELAAYRATTKIRQAFPIQLKRIRANAEIKDWPSTITISE